MIERNMYRTLFITLISATIIDAAYLGCFKETQKRRTYNRNPGAIKPGTLTPENCLTLCGGLGLPYGALGAGKFCWCGNSSPVGLLTLDATDTKCGLPCDGDAAQTCGSITHVRIFDALSPIEVSIDISQRPIPTGDAVVFTPNVVTANSGYKLSFDYDDNAGATAYETSGTNLLTRTFYQASKYNVKATATNSDETLQPVETAVGCLVVTRPSQVILECPSDMATYEPGFCTAIIPRGTDMEFQVDYTDGAGGAAISRTFSIPDAIEYSIGNSVLAYQTGPQITLNNNGLILLQTTQAEFSGTLSAFEFYAAVTGTLRVYIYRPNCGGNTYCYVSNACQAGSCSPSCGGDYCMDINYCCTGLPTRADTLLANYDQVYAFDHTITTTGHGGFTVSDGIDILPGDIVGYESTSSGLLTYVPGTGNQDYYCASLTGGPASVAAGSCATTTEKTQLKAIYASQSRVMLPFDFTLPGAVTVQTTVRNKDSSIALNVVNSTVINVLEGVDKCVFSLPSCIRANNAFQFTLEQFTGTSVQVEWDFGNTDILIVTTNPNNVVTYTYLTPATYTISVNISNALSFKANTTSICVEEEIVGLTLGVTAGVEVGVSTRITLQMTSGSDYTCALTFTYSASGTTEVLNFNAALYPPNSVINHLFSEAGASDLAITCSNNINTAQATKSVTSVERITGLRLDPPGAQNGVDYYIIVRWDGGSNVQLTVTYDGVVEPMTMDSSGTYAISTLKPATSLSTHTVNVSASNALSTETLNTNFIIEVPMVSPSISCTFPSEISATGSGDKKVIPIGTTGECSFSMTDGTSISINIDWGDGTPAYTYTTGVGNPWVGNEPAMPVTHTYNVAAEAATVVTISNNMEDVIETYNVIPMVNVDNVFLNPAAPELFLPPAVVNFSWTVTGPMPNSVFARIEWGENNFDEFENLDLSVDLQHAYRDMAGELTLTWHIWNYASSKTDSLTVDIVTPIVNPTCTSNPIAGIPNIPVDIVFKSQRGPGAGLPDLTFNCGNGVVIPTRKRQANSPDGEDIEQCTYTSTGTYTVQVTMTTLLESGSCTYSLDILNPVTDTFNILSNTPIDYEVANTCDATIQVDFTGGTLPDNAFLDFDYGDGTVETGVVFGPSVSRSYSYATHGVYSTTIRIYNDASEVTKIIESGCYADITATSMTILRQPFLPIGGPDLEGFGALKDQFRTDEPLKIYPTLTGTFGWYEVSATSADHIFSCNSTDQTVAALDVPEPGSYVVSLQALNPLYPGPIETSSITVIEPSDGITITDYGIRTNAYQPKTFNISMSSYGTGMCVAINNYEDSFVHLYGDSTTCSVTSVSAWPTLPVQYDASKDVTASFEVVYTFNSEKDYTIEVYAWNDYSVAESSLDFSVSGIDCSAPNVDIESRHSSFNNPRQYIRSKRARIVGTTDIACPQTLKNTKQWYIETYDGINNVALSSVDISSLDSQRNAELSLSPHFLPYGLYKLTYEVKMNTATPSSAADFMGKTYTFIEIVESELVVQLYENAVGTKTVGPSVSLTLDPKANSYDPDVDTAAGEVDNFDSFLMSCIDLTNGEVRQPTNVTVIPSNLADLPIGHVNQGGCFQTGPGWFYLSSGSVTFGTDILTPNHKYEIHVIGYKGQRESEFTGTLEVLTADPPECGIRFKQPAITNSASKGKLFSAAKQLGLEVSTPCTTCTYQWELYLYDYEYSAVDDGWRLLPYLFRYIEGTESEELTIHTNVFSHYEDRDLFQVRLAITDTTTGMTGKSNMNLIRNRPPYGGNCTIDPIESTAMITNHTVECGGFVDDDNTVEDYTVYCVGNGVTTEVASGSSGRWLNRYLPSGNSSSGDLIECFVEVTDDLGAVGTYSIGNYTSHPPALDDLKSTLTNWVADEASYIGLVDATAKLEETTAVLSALSPALKDLSKNDENIVYRGMGSAASFKPTGLSGDIREEPFSAPNPDPAALEVYENLRDTAGKVLKSLMATTKISTLADNHDAKLTLGSMRDISSNTAFLQRDTQNDIVEMMGKGISVLKANQELLSVEDAQTMTADIMDICSNLQESIVLNADHPSNDDMRNQEEPVQTFPTNLDGDTKEVGFFTSDAEALLDGKKILNKKSQTSATSSVSNNCKGMKDSMVDILADIKPRSNEPFTYESNSVELSIMKSTRDNLVNRQMTGKAGAFSIPSDALSDVGADETLTFVYQGSSNPGLVIEDGLDSAADKYTRCLEMSFKNSDGSAKKVKNLKNPITMEISRDPYRPAQNDSAFEYLNPQVLDTRPDDIGVVQNMLITKPNSGILIKFLNMTNITSTNQLLVMVNFEEIPELNGDHSKVKHVCMIPKHTRNAGQSCSSNQETDPYTCFVGGNIIGNKTGDWKILIRQMHYKEMNLYQDVPFLPKTVPAEWKTDREFYQNFMLKTVELSCAYFESGSTVLKTDGCEPEEVCDDSTIKCKCNHLTSFAGGWVVAPNTIDWDFIFSNADFFKNPTLYITEIIIGVVYILAFIWARRGDKQDLTKLGLAPLLDNDPRDKYYYEVMVNTGMRRNAGTESKVHFILSGEEDETDVRTFTDKKRKIFQRGNTDGFLMAVESSLGSLSYLRIWHDNSGKGKSASWYLNHIVIRDVQTDRKYYFIANKWFAVEEEDGQVDRVIPVAGKAQMTEFSYMFSERATKNLSDGHLWFSVVARPPQSRFTRCQRVSCCLCLLYMSMLANAMFYGTQENSDNAFQFGPFALTPEQIFIGIASNLLIFPVNFLIITLFRKSRPRKLRPSRVEEALKSMPERTTSMTDVNMRVKSSMSNERPGSSFLIDAKQSDPRPDSSLSAETPLTKSKKKKKCQLPWWFTIIAWILLWVAVLVSAAFVTFYGIMFQDLKCKKWITSMLISFFTSVFLTQPIKVFLFAIIFSLIIKNPGGEEEETDEDEEPTRKLNSDEELLHDEEDGYGLAAPRRAIYKPKPPNQKTLEAARKQRLKEMQMWSVIREILFYAFFLWILLVISYKSVSNNSYNYKHNMEKVFILTNSNHTFTGIKNVADYWKWARGSMLRGLRAGPYYNNFPPFYMRGYIDDKVSRLMGYAVLRQLRVEPDSCKIPYQVENIIDECNAPYSIGAEQRQSFGPGWTSDVNSTRSEYTYTDADALNGYPYWGEMAMYSGGGYVVRLNQDYHDMVAQFHQLESERWIDEYTRAVFLEFTVYNPSINMFAISTLVAEFRPSGGVFPAYRFEPATLLPYMSSALLFQVICEIVYFLFTLYFIFKECRAFYKQRLEYFKQFWNIIELCICAMSITAIVIYFYRLVCINELTEYFKETNGNGYMKFQYVGYWSEIFSYIIGFLVYFACLKFLKLLRFNKKVSLLTDTLKNSAKDLIHFSIIFNIVFMAFIQVFYLIYVARISTFRTFLSSCEAGIVMMMGKFDIYNMLEVNQWLTQVFLFLFVVTITFIVVNMFLSILNDTFGAVRNNMSKQSNDYEIVEFMMDRFKLWTGLGRSNSTTISPTDMENQRRNNYNTLEGKIDNFPDQIDRFLASISNMYMEKSKFDDFLHKGAYGKMAKKAEMHGGSLMHPAPKPGSTRLSNGSRGMTDVQTD